MHAFPILDLKYVMWWVGMLLVFLENEGDGFWNSFDMTFQPTSDAKRLERVNSVVKINSSSDFSPRNLP